MLMVKREGVKAPNTAAGQVYGRLTIIDPGPFYEAWDGDEVGNIRRVLVRCECENEYYTREAAVVNGNATQCMACKHRAQSKLLSKENTGWNIWKNHYVQNARAKKRVFELTDEEFLSLCKSDCFYCGAVPTIRYLARGNEIIANGIDRVDSSGGYTKDNTVSCCTVCNKMKLALTTEEFYAHVERIYEFRLK